MARSYNTIFGIRNGCVKFKVLKFYSKSIHTFCRFVLKAFQCDPEVLTFPSGTATLLLDGPRVGSSEKACYSWLCLKELIFVDCKSESL